MQNSDSSNNAEPSSEEKALLDRELEEYRANPDAGVSWDEVKARLLERERSDRE